MKNRTWAAAAVLALAPAAARGAHFAAVAPARPAGRALTVPVTAQVIDDTAAGVVPAGPRSYHLAVEVPEGAVPDLRIGDRVRVALPIIHQPKAEARVLAVDDKEVLLLLPGQIQQLRGLVLTAELPLKARRLFLVPLEAVYSPRGLTTQVFTLKDGRAALVAVKVLAARENGDLVVSSSGLDGQTVLTDGLDNLVNGDAVTAVPASEGEGVP
jgi:hypothetical protein